MTINIITIGLPKRVAIHKSGLVPGFTKQYSINKLVYFEIHKDKEEALQREKFLKNGVELGRLI